MSTTQIILIGVVAIVAVLIGVRSRPRVTQIDRKAEREKEMEDRDDA
jgi:hypothetical protein